MKKKHKPIIIKKPKGRNYLAIHAFNKSSAVGGAMKDDKKQDNKNYCRKEEEE